MTDIPVSSAITRLCDPVDISGHRNNTAISAATETKAGEFNVWGNSFAAEYLPAGESLVHVAGVLVNPARVNDDNMPAFLRGWDRVVCPELVDTGFVGDHPRSSVWIGMNFLVVAPGKAIVDKRQSELIRELERHGVEMIPAQLTPLQNSRRWVPLRDARRAPHGRTCHIPVKRAVDQLSAGYPHRGGTQ